MTSTIRAYLPTSAQLLFACTLVLLLAGSSIAAPDARAVKVKLEMAKMDQVEFLDKLNEHGKDKGLAFAVADDFDYRINYHSGAEPRLADGTTVNKKAAVATVYDKSGEEVFTVEKNDRNTAHGVMNAVSKDVVKKLAEWIARGK